MHIYTRETIAAAPWPPGDSGRPILSALVREGPRPFVANVSADVAALAAGGAVMPLVRVDAAPASPNAYVCSPTTHYVDYARREVELELHARKREVSQGGPALLETLPGAVSDWAHEAGRSLLRAALPPALEALRPLMRWSEVERIVYVNNWLLSTNLYPALGAADVAAIRDGLLAAYPDHTIVFRSLNEGLNGPLIAALEGLGFERVFSRQVYLLDPRDGAYRRRNNYGNDRRLARRSAYRWRGADEIPPGASERLRALYDDLYIGKYSRYNPRLTARFIAEALAGGWLTVLALEAGGRLDGVLGFIEQHGVLTAPLVGYDRGVAANAGLYRLLMLELVEQAAARGRVLHLSSGAASFKRLRGGEPWAEYSLVYHRHLPARRRLPWRLLAWLSRRAIIPLMEWYQL